MENRPNCQCGKPCKRLGKSKKGKQYYSKYCTYHHKVKYEKRWNYKDYKKDSCERCGFIPEHPCQLDVDHIDGNKQNNLENNFQTLCANCHRLKTQLNKDHTNVSKAPYGAFLFL